MRRAGTTFIEIVIAMAMLAAALVPIASMLSGTAQQTAHTKAEAAAASYAATLMNTFLDKVPFDHAVLAQGVQASESFASDPDVPSNTTIDGTQIRWTLEVEDIMPDEVWLTHWRVRYNQINECPPSSGGTATALPGFSNTVRTRVNFGGAQDRHIGQLDSKAATDSSGTPVAAMKELRLTIQWRTPRDTAFETLGPTIDETRLRRSVSLLTRRARLRRTL